MSPSLPPLAGGNINARSAEGLHWPYIFFNYFAWPKKILGNGVEREMIGCGIRDETFVWISDGSELR